MFQFSTISKIAFIGAIALGIGMPSTAQAGLKRKAKKILASPVGAILTGSPLPLNWKKSLSLTKPVVIKNGQSCQTFHIDSAYRDSPSSKVMLPVSPMVVKSVTGTVHIGSGLDIYTYTIVDSDVMYPATLTRPIVYQPAQAGAPGLSIPPLGHEKIRFGLLRPNYQEWPISTTSEGDSIADLRKGMTTNGLSADRYLTMILQARVQGEHDDPLPASGAHAATAILEVCVA